MIGTLATLIAARMATGARGRLMCRVKGSGLLLVAEECQRHDQGHCTLYILANVSARGFAISSALPIHLMVLSETVTMNTADM